MPSIEAYRPADAADAAALLGDTPEAPKATEASFRAFTELTFNRGARDFRLVRERGRVVALLTSTMLEHSEPAIRHFRIVVHPEHRRLGIARRLLAEVEAQATLEPLGPSILQCNSQRTWLSGNAFLERHGFNLTSRELLMRLSTGATEAPARGLARDITLRRATEADDVTWSELHAVGYADRDDFSPLRAQDLIVERSKPGFALLMAEQRGRVVGLCHGLRHEGAEGLINSVVVRAEHRAKGIGASLVAATVAALRASGCTSVTLNVTAQNEPAIHVYQRLGFETYDEILCYQRQFTPDAVSVASGRAAPGRPRTFY